MFLVQAFTNPNGTWIGMANTIYHHLKTQRLLLSLLQQDLKQCPAEEEAHALAHTTQLVPLINPATKM